MVAKHLCRDGQTCKQMDGLQQWCPASRSRDCCLLRARNQPHRECGSVLQAVRHDVHLNHITDSCDAGPARIRSLVSRCSRHVAWRTRAGCAMRAISDGQVLAAELFEDFLLKPQLVLLRPVFPAAEGWSSCRRTTPCRIDACLRAAPPPWRRRCFPLRSSSNL